MEAHESKSNHKRQYENDDSPPESKHQRPATPEQPMKITDLDDDCLEKIFERLDLCSLCNVVASNALLRPAARTVYKRKCGIKKVHIYSSAPGLKVSAFDNHISVSGLKMCLQFLRCFGSSIINLYISYARWNNKQCGYIHQYINKYCAESLVKLVFHHKPNISIDCFKKPFVNVRTVTVCSGDLADQFPLFAQWFPNIHTLKLMSVCIGNRYIDTSFHHLHDLRIDLIRNRHITDECVNRLFHKCRQLKSLTIGLWDSEGMTLNKLLNFIKYNPMICKLAVSMRSQRAVTPTEMRQLVSEHPSLVELDLKRFEFAAMDAVWLIEQLESLKKFCFKMDNQLEYDRFVAQLDSKWQPSSCFEWFGRVITVKC